MRSQRGDIILQVLIAAVMLGVVGVGIMSSLTNQVKSQKVEMQRDEADEYIRVLSMYFSDPAYCKKNLITAPRSGALIGRADLNRGVAVRGLASVGGTDQLDSFQKTLFAPMTEVRSMNLRPPAHRSATLPGVANKTLAELNFVFEPTQAEYDSDGLRQRSILLLITWSPAGAMTGCQLYSEKGHRLARLQDCRDGQFALGLNADGQLTCGAFPVSHCRGNQKATALNKDGQVVCKN